MFAGGKFLINSIGLSDDAVFQSSSLINQQLQGDFGTNQKLKYLLDALADTPKQWDDLGLGENEIFNGDIAVNLVKVFKKHHIILGIHSIPELQNYLTTYPNALIVLFTNSAQFIEHRNNMDLNDIRTSKWNSIKEKDWNKTIPNELSNEITNIISDKHPNAINVISPTTFEQELIKFTHGIQNKQITWDCEWYTDINTTLKNIKKLYEYIQISDVNSRYLELYYNAWKCTFSKYHS
jgi:hypothetical protein